VKRTPLTRSTPLRRSRIRHQRKPLDLDLVTARARAADRARGRCEAGCASTCTGRAVHAHHRLPRSAGGEHTAGNLLMVCHACHGFIHANPAASYDAGHLLRRGTPCPV
jgi:hypothetical protein